MLFSVKRVIPYMSHHNMSFTITIAIYRVGMQMQNKSFLGLIKGLATRLSCFL